VQGIFEGVKVLDFTNVLSGPSVTRLLVEFGADVVKVELPPAGDMSRHLPAVRNGRSGYFVQQNRGKRCICVDVKDPRGREVVMRLVDEVDVLVQNFSPGVIERLGFDWATVSARNPRLVMCSISAFGTEGPLRDHPGYDAIAQAYGGVLHMNGEADRPPALMGLSPGDVLTGVHGFGAVAAALYHRERTGRGQRVEISLLGCYLTCHEVNVQAWSISQGAMDPMRSGSVHPFVGGYGVFPVAGGHVIIAAANDRQWAAMCHAMGRPELAADERYLATAGRVERRGEVNAIITAWLATQPDRDTALAAMQAQHVPAAPVLSVEEAVGHPHLRQTGIVRTVHDERIGDFDIPGVPIHFSEFPEVAELAASELGGDNEAVLTGMAGLRADDYAALVQAGVIVAADDRA